ncbi:unnamed protein product [Rotaria socialis]|uniref:PiggyBac transposable element-derived protein domain-containing protein n=1 Tax=Rotaria socialis TaxID=392032 RepID=A0A821D0F7_9BILA|nr:unnamed protein product [Rotaria socialis]
MSLTSDEEIDSSESEDEVSKVAHNLRDELIMSETSSSSDSAFAGTLPPPPMNEELEPIDYFFSMVDKKSIALLTDQSNLSVLQTNPSKPQLNRTDPNFDRAHKVRPLLNIVKENFIKTDKEEKLSVGEQIIPFKGKSIMKQHMPNKPNRWGYKMFLLAGGESGICYDFILYAGKSDKQEYGFCTNIVLDLCATVPRAINHKVYCDNYFTTIRLQVELKKLGIYTVGTVKPNRLTDLTMKNKKELSSEDRGAMDHRIAEVDGVTLCVTRWYDNNVVNCLSTLHDCEPLYPAERWSSQQKKTYTNCKTECYKNL